MNAPDLPSQDLSCLWHPFTQHLEWQGMEPLVIHEAEGCWLIDGEGHRYLDGISSLWTNVHGHRHPELDEALRIQLGKVAHSTLLGLTHPPAITLAKELLRRAPEGLTRVFYSDNGSTAVEVALKMAFQYQQQNGAPDRTRFASLSDAYHGDTLGSVSVGSIELFHRIYRPLLFNGVALPAPTHPGTPEEESMLARGLELLDAHGHELAALVVEPLVQGAAGMKMHSPRFLKTLMERARELGVLLIADEVAVGFGRLGTLFAMEKVGVAPDFLCVAKGLGAGYLPIAATLAPEAVYEGFLGDPETHRQFFHGHTFTGNPLACAVALRSLELFESEDVLAHVGRLEAHLAGKLETLGRLPSVASIRHQGVMIGIDLTSAEGTPFPPGRRVGHQVAMAARGHGVILRPLGDTLVINPPLSMTMDEADVLMDATYAAIQDVTGSTS